MISPNPNPTPGTTTGTPGQPSPRTSSSGTERETSFSRLLSGELDFGRTQQSQPGNEVSGLSDGERRPGRNHDLPSDSLSNDPQTPQASGQRSDSTVSGSENLSQSELPFSGFPGEADAFWGGLNGLIQLGQPLAMVGPSVPGIVANVGMPADMVAGLAADIAAAYSEKNGVQTLTMNLEQDHLGRVEVRLQARGNQLSVRLVAASPEAESAMRDNLKDLTEAIQTRTGRYQQVEVRVELKETQEPDRDPADEEQRQFKGQDSDKEQSRKDDPENQASGNRDNQVETEPGLLGQKG